VVKAKWAKTSVAKTKFSLMFGDPSIVVFNAVDVFFLL
jgi:hypothetical protein